MVFTLDEVVPWGRSFEEYVAMFALSEADLGRRILGCSDGPAGFNSVLTKRGGRVVSADPLYQFRAEQIGARIDEAYELVLEQTRRNRDEFVWDRIASVEELGRIRMAAMREFLSDFESGKRQGRYQTAGLPVLPFRDGEFDLALCSHFLFVYSAHFTADFHVSAIEEMCRTSAEARIFPVLELGSRKSRHLDEVIDRLESSGYNVAVQTVAYEFQKGGNQMLKVSAG